MVSGMQARKQEDPFDWDNVYDWYDSDEDAYCHKCGLHTCVGKPCICPKCKQPERACACKD